jgi:hypothetical protein
VIVPLVDATAINGNGQVPVLGFAVICVDSTSGNNNTVDATFLEFSTGHDDRRLRTAAIRPDGSGSDPVIRSRR